MPPVEFPSIPRGPIAWMAQNPVSANLLMAILILGGLMMAFQIKQEVFPEFEADLVTATIAYPGASPAEVEQGIVLAVEEALRSLEGIAELRTTAAEGVARIDAELRLFTDQQRVYQDIQQAIDRITTFPAEAEEPEVQLVNVRRDVLEVNVFGPVDPWALRQIAERVRDRLVQHPAISQAELENPRAVEVVVEIPRERLRQYDLTLNEVADRIRATALELPAGTVETPGGDVLLRFAERRDWAEEFARIPILNSPQGTPLRLEDIAAVRDDFEDTDRVTTFDGSPAMSIEVFRVGRETPIGVSDAAQAVMAEVGQDLPTGISYTITNDRSTIYRQRLALLLKNACIGLGLVLLMLSLFLELSLAFWVTVGIATAFVGAFLFLPLFAVSINMISMFAFILALGIVVDDAIVAGENIYEYRQRGMDYLTAAIRGAQDVARPITFSVLTNIAAFIPLWFIPGGIGKVWAVIPAVVVTVFIISWVEALFIMPAHLAGRRRPPPRGWWGTLSAGQRRISRGLNRFVEGAYAPLLRRCLEARYLTLAAGLALLLVVVAFALSGRLGFQFMPRVEADEANATATLPIGAPLAAAEAVRERLLAGAEAVIEPFDRSGLVAGIIADIEDNVVEVRIYLQPPDRRPMGAAQFVTEWRQAVGEISGLQTLAFQFDRGGPGSGKAITVELSHPDTVILDVASQRLAAALEEFPNSRDVDDGFESGKEQLDFRLTEAGRSLGLTTFEVARQVRAAFNGVEALSQQRGRNEVTVRVRLPGDQRISEYDIEQLMVRIPSGGEVPLRTIAAVERGRAYTTIRRRDGRRTVSVTANVEPPRLVSQLQAALVRDVLPELQASYPQLSYGFEGRQRRAQDSLDSLFSGFLLVLLVIYALLAIPFKSYIQPLIVMSAIPFGIVGAVLGHVIMGYGLSIISILGLVALSGVVINDSLVMVDYANTRRRAGHGAFAAIYQAGVRRFRPIVLTTITTFGGLAPMIFEASRQARFLIPMALSLGFGILFTTVLILLLVPCLYLVVEDLVATDQRGKTPAGDEGAAIES